MNLAPPAPADAVPRLLKSGVTTDRSYPPFQTACQKLFAVKSTEFLEPAANVHRGARVPRTALSCCAWCCERTQAAAAADRLCVVSIYSCAATTAADSSQTASLALRHHTVHLRLHDPRQHTAT